MAKPFEFNIKKLYADLRPSEQKVADYYLGYAGQLEELSLVPMAKAAGVSQPTVMRFVKALGFGGFREFKYAVLKAASGRGNMEADAKADSRADGSGGAVPPPGRAAGPGVGSLWSAVMAYQRRTGRRRFRAR